MKRSISKIMVALLIVGLLTGMSSCATIFGGQVTTCQKTKPVEGAPSRSVRVAPLIADIVLFWPSLIVDFATNAIYRPCGSERVPNHHKR